jgi:glucosamine-6-phosphate deaminase
MQIKIYKNKKELSKAAVKQASMILKDAIKQNGEAVFVVATGTTQLEFLDMLSKKDVDWSKTTLFHLDEYIGISNKSNASFNRYVKERVVNKLKPGKYYLINGNVKDPKKECKRLGKLIARKKVDVVFLGIGENGHIAFNEPPADFKTKNPFIIVKLGEISRLQQVKEGWFSKIDKVPKKAISMSIQQIIKSRNILLLADGLRKAKTISSSFNGKISPKFPASILQKHKNAFVYLDQDASSLLIR